MQVTHTRAPLLPLSYSTLFHPSQTTHPIVITAILSLSLLSTPALLILVLYIFPSLLVPRFLSISRQRFSIEHLGRNLSIEPFCWVTPYGPTLSVQ